MVVKAELEANCIIRPILKTFIYSLVRSKNLCFSSIPEDLKPDMQKVLGYLPHVSLREQNIAGTDFTLHCIHPREHLPKS